MSLQQQHAVDALTKGMFSCDELASTAVMSPNAAAAMAMALNGPKFPGTVIPNRIFVGGLPSNATETELKNFFSSHGLVKDAKVISDRNGLSKGVYGFVTFETKEVAEKIIQNESESLIFKDRKLNIGPAVRKNHMLPRTDLSGTFLLTNGNYQFQNIQATVLPITGQDYSVLQAPYMVLPQQPMYISSPYGTYPNALPALQAAGNAASQSDQWAPISVTSQGTGLHSSTPLSGNVLSANNLSNTSAQQAWRWTSNPSNPQNTISTPTLFYPGPGPDIMYAIHPGTAGNFTPNSSSDYSTDQSLFDSTEHDTSPRRLQSDNYNQMNASERVMHLSGTVSHKLYPGSHSIASAAGIFGHQLIQGGGNGSVKQGAIAAQPLAAYRVLPAASMSVGRGTGNSKDEKSLAGHAFIEQSVVAAP